MNASRSVVYFAFLGEEGTDAELFRRRLSYMEQQLAWLAQLIEAAPYSVEVLVPYVAPREFDAEVRGAVEGRGFKIDPASVLADRRNTFEYPGFRAMKALAEASPPERLIYYCHTKGIMQLSESKMGLFRWHTQIGLTADLAPLEAEPSLTRACIFPSKFGWCFFNFFWIKAGYMAALPVEEMADRYQFECLVGDPADREGYQGVLPLPHGLPIDNAGSEPRRWYRATETETPEVVATYNRFFRMQEPPRLADRASDPTPYAPTAPAIRPSLLARIFGSRLPTGA